MNVGLRAAELREPLHETIFIPAARREIGV
jgi:hypothetical protein